MTTKATLNPAQEAITETRVLVEAKPATVTLEMSLEDAELVRALLGRTCGDDGWEVYRALDELAKAGSIRRMRLSESTPKISTELILSSF